MTDLIQKISAFFIFLVTIAVAMTFFFLFTYVFLVILVIALIGGGIAYLYARFIQKKKTTSVQIHYHGRIIDQEDDPNV